MRTWWLRLTWRIRSNNYCLISPSSRWTRYRRSKRRWLDTSWISAKWSRIRRLLYCLSCCCSLSLKMVILKSSLRPNFRPSACSISSILTSSCKWNATQTWITKRALNKSTKTRLNRKRKMDLKCNACSKLKKHLFNCVSAWQLSSLWIATIRTTRI